MRIKLLDLLTAVTACSALLIAGIVAWDRFGGDQPQTNTDRAIDDEQWRELTAKGHRMGADQAPVVIVEFGDYECPACRSFHRTLKSVLPIYPDEVAVIYRHWPLNYHRYAYSAARAAECASEQGRFAEYHTALFDQPDRLGEWEAIAQEVGVSDAESFAACVADTAPHPVIERDVRDVAAIDPRGTPTVVINGLYLLAGRDSARLTDIINGLLAES